MPVRAEHCLAVAILLVFQPVPARSQSVEHFGHASTDSSSTAAGAVILPWLSSGFGYRRHPLDGAVRLHSGIDIPVPLGTPVRAAAPGQIGHAGRAGGYGLMVEIRHANAMQTRYAHLSRVLVAPGEQVAEGQVIALAGSTGRSTGNHLHFEVRQNGQARDPLPFLSTPRAFRRFEAAPLLDSTPHVSEFARARERSIAANGDEL
ncbi:M23 family metallopeptidase [Aurantiacibacter hainanensis]|uniref:M23 family metallopeptidase n=1 Tax=Aurantiacibacter hainanensis TaxID=3076114 RepID=UPI0030C76239